MIKYVQDKKIDYNRLEEILLESSISNQFTNNGPTKKRLEEMLEEILNIEKDKRVICVANGTLALHGLLLFLHKKNITNWVTPSLTFPSSVVNTSNVSIEDIDLKTLTINLEAVSKHSGAIITSLFGTYPDNILEWESLNKTIILDVASSPMTTINGRNICNFGNYSFGSLHHTKYFGFGEGGFIVAPKNEYHEIISTLGFGFKLKEVKRRHDPKSSNYKMSDIAAASIIQHLERYDLNKHIEIQNEMIDFVNSIGKVEPLKFNDGVIYGNLPLLFNKTVGKDFFLSNGLEVQKYYYPLCNHRNSFSIYDRIINFPLHSGLYRSQIEKMKRLIEEFLK